MALASTAVGDAGRPDAPTEWRSLVIDGQRVQWPTRSAFLPLRLTYAVATRHVSDPAALHCKATDPLSAWSASAQLRTRAVEAAVARAFGHWERITRITFTRVDDATNADIVVSGLAPDARTAFPGAAFTDLTLGAPIAPGTTGIRQARICFSATRAWKIGFDGNLARLDVEHVATHEIGHALGLDHPGARGPVMAFRYQETTRGLARGDIAGAQALYGRPLIPFGAN